MYVLLFFFFFFFCQREEEFFNVLVVGPCILDEYVEWMKRGKSFEGGEDSETF